MTTTTQQKVPALRFSNFSDDWKQKKIGKITELTSSKRVYLSDYVNHGIPFYRGKEISELKANLAPKDILYITEERYEDFKSKYGVPQINDILVTAVGTLGNVLRIKNNCKFYFKDGNLIWFRKISENPSFLEILLEVRKRDLLRTSIGSTQRALTMVELRKINLPLPTKQEQQKIATFLSAVDTKIEQLNNKKVLWEQYKKGMMQKLFSQEIRFKDEQGNEYPDWERLHLDKTATVIMGTSPRSTAYNHNKEGLPLIQGNADVRNRKSAPKVYTTEITKECLPNDTLLSVRAPVGKVSNAIQHACIGRGIAVIRAKSSVLQAFLYNYLILYESKWKRISQGSTFESVNSNDVRSIRICIPSTLEQQKIATFLSTIDQKIELVTTELKQARTFKKGLLQQMFI